jgi:hypothetical protein
MNRLFAFEIIRHAGYGRHAVKLRRCPVISLPLPGNLAEESAFWFFLSNNIRKGSEGFNQVISLFDA